jgi:hypothetical protein
MNDYNNFDDIERIILTVETCKERYACMVIKDGNVLENQLRPLADLIMESAGEQDRRDMMTSFAAMRIGDSVVETVKRHISIAHGPKTTPAAAGVY